MIFKVQGGGAVMAGKDVDYCQKWGGLKIAPPPSPPPQMCGLPKIHKEGYKMRPIVSAIGSPSYGLAKELSCILAPLAGHTYVS